jgi:hypothetical protein
MNLLPTAVLAHRAAIGSIVLTTAFVALSVEGEPWLFAVISGLLAAVLFLSWWSREERMGTAQALFYCIAIVMMFVPGTRDDISRLFDSEVRVWNVYHYYMGSKYFDELRYTDIYIATLKADREGSNYWTGVVHKTRDLKTYDVISVEDVVSAYDPSARFTPERWASFRVDVEALASHRSARGWRGIFRDRGYNPPPVWTAVGGFLSNNIKLDRSGLLLLASFDILLLLAMGFAVIRAFGAVPALLVLLLFVVSPTNIPRAFGGFLQFDWLASIVIGVCLLQRNKFGWAGIVLAYALMTRVFPLFMIAGFFVPVLAYVIGHRRIPSHGLKFFVGVAVGATGLFAISLIQYGVSAWFEFVSAILTHSGGHVLGEQRIGLEHAYTAGPDWLGDTINKSGRAALLQQRAYLYWIACVTLVTAYLLVAWRSRPIDALILGMIVVFSVLVLSRYYYGMLVLIPLIARTHREALLLTGLQIMVFAAGYALLTFGAHRHMQYVALNIGLALYFAYLLAEKLFPVKNESIKCDVDGG